MNRRALSLLVSLGLFTASLRAADETGYIEPGSLRLSHDLIFEGILHRPRAGWNVLDAGLNKAHYKSGDGEKPWKGEFGQRLLTEAAARFSEGISSRVLFEVQGDYADRWWRPLNIEHYADDRDKRVILRQGEARIDRENWYTHGFLGVGHGNWAEKGDFWGLYPSSYPEDDYLGLSGYFGVYPDHFKQDLYLNLAHRNVPRGVEAGAQFGGVTVAGAYGNELHWGYNRAGYALLGVPIRKSQLTFVYKNDDVPYAEVIDTEDRDQAYALSWGLPFEAGHRLDVGVLYRPYRVGDRYRIARDAAGGTGVQGSAFNIGERTTERSDAFAERVRFDWHSTLADRLVIWTIDAMHAGVLAGNKNEGSLQVAGDVTTALKAFSKFTYRKPVEGPVPFLYEGTPDNMGAVVSFPRGPESPFFVDWNNREARLWTTTLIFDPTPGTNLFQYDPQVLSAWNINPQETSPFSLAAQYRFSDYPTTTDRQFYYNEQGSVVWEPAAGAGAWATADPIHEFRLLGLTKRGPLVWTLGVAGGEQLAGSGLAYTLSEAQSKPITEYFSLETRIDYWPIAWWAHYGTGVWGPEPFQAFFGASFDRLYGMGVSYKFTLNTTLELAYTAARQDDDKFVAPDLGSYDEIRTLISHRFGFLFQFQDSARPGYQAR